jgi:pilus assembly protein Flp/PilA
MLSLKTSKALRRLRTEADGIASFEYVTVAACVVAAVGIAFGTDASTGIAAALISIVNAVVAAVQAVVV